MRLLRETLPRRATRLLRLTIRLLGVLALFPYRAIFPHGAVFTHRTVFAHRTLFPHRPVIARGTILAHHRAAIFAHRTIAAILIAVVAIAEALMIAITPERTVLTLLVAVVVPIVEPPLALVAMVLLMRLRLERRHVRLAVLETLVEDVFLLVLARLVRTAFGRLRSGMAVYAVATMGRELLAIGHDDAIVVLGVLKIILRKYVVAGGLSVPGKRHVLFCDMCRRTANFDIRAVRLEAARKRILVLSIVVIIIVVTSATAAILLSLPHCLEGSR